MKALFVSGDVGGARALLPIMAECERKAVPFYVFEHGHIVKELPRQWDRVKLNGDLNKKRLTDLFKEKSIGVLVFTSSVKDTLPLLIARQAKHYGIPVIHVLDNWAGYRRNMGMDGLPIFIPDIYTVIDDVSFEGALKEGIDRDVIKMTGQPALASLSKEVHSQYNANFFIKERKSFGFDTNKKLILFISEPVELDQGSSPANPHYRGYTEKTVLTLLCEHLQPYAEDIEVGILPHPREDSAGLLNTWEKCCGTLKGGLIRLSNGRESLFWVDGVAGMNSLLLYEAWLIGKPVISIQPGLRYKTLRVHEKRDGIVFVDSVRDVESKISEWFSKINLNKKISPRPELEFHERAPDKNFEYIEMLLKKNNHNVLHMSTENI